MQLEHTFTVPTGVEQAWQVLLDIERVAPCMPGASLDSVDGDEFTGTVKVRLGPIGLTYKGRASFVEKDETAHRVVLDAQGRDARGNGTASAKVTATLVAEGEESTRVAVLTDLNITGRPAQVGRGVMVDVGNKLIGQFADCLAGKLAGTDTPPLAEAETPVGDAVVGDAVVGDAVVGDAVVGDAVVGDAVVGDAEPAEPAGGPAPAERPGIDVAAGIQATADSSAPGTDPIAPTFTEPASGSVEPINLLGSAGPALAKRLAPVAVAALALVLFVILRRRR